MVRDKIYTLREYWKKSSIRCKRQEGALILDLNTLKRVSFHIRYKRLVGNENIITGLFKKKGEKETVIT